MKYAVRSLIRAKGLSVTVIVTLALGIGVNAAIFSLVRSVLLRPLVNRDEQRILYIRQSAPGIGSENITFSVPEIQDLREPRALAVRRRRVLDDHASRWSASASRGRSGPASSAATTSR